MLSGPVPGRWMGPPRGPAAPHAGPGSGASGQMTAQGSAAGTWQVSGRSVPRRLVRAAFPAAHATFPAGPTAWPASLLMGGLGGGPPGTGPAWPASHPCFVRSLECPGTQSAAPWGDTGAVPLISSLDRFLLHSSLGLGQAPSPSCCQSPSVCVCPSPGSQQSCSWEPGGFPRGGGSPSPSVGGPWACL